MKITAIAPWFGSKRTLAPRIVAELGKHSAYWEPFCGSMAVLLEKPAVRMETVNDLHQDLTNLARVIQHTIEGPRFYRKLRRTWASESLFDECVSQFGGSWDGSLNPDRAFVYFVTSWLGRSGIAGTNIGQPRGAGHSFCVRYTATGGQPNKRWFSAIESIPEWRERMKNVTVLTRDAFEIIDKIEDSIGTAIYVDPPYLDETRSGIAGSGGQSRYRHDFEDANHSLLADKLRSFSKARVVVSYYAHAKLTSMYPGWTVIDCATSKSIANMGRRDKAGATVAPEVLLINGPSLTSEDADAMAGQELFA